MRIGAWVLDGEIGRGWGAWKDVAFGVVCAALLGALVVRGTGDGEWVWFFFGGGAGAREDVLCHLSFFSGRWWCFCGLKGEGLGF